MNKKGGKEKETGEIKSERKRKDKKWRKHVKMKRKKEIQKT